MEFIFYPKTLMKKFLQKHSSKVVAGAAIIAGVMPAFASAASMTGGILIPTGTTASVVTAVGSYFIDTLMKTLFGAEMISLLVVLGTLGLVVFVVKKIWRHMRHPGN